MKKVQYIFVTLASAGIVGAGALGVASAASSSTGNVGSSGIPRSVFKQERLDAAGEVLNTTTANIQSAHKNKTFSQLISAAGLTKKTYSEKLKTQLTSDLVAKGYSQDQVTIALQHRVIVRLHHHDKK